MQLKNFTLSILFLFSLSFANAQCEVVNGDFEEWFETDFILPDGGDGEASGEVILPLGGTPFIRLLFLSFAAAFDPSYGMLLETEAQELSGISQSTDASEGEFALKLQAGYDIEFADIYSLNACTEVPEQFNLDVKHVGETNDTLTVYVLFDQGLNPVPQSEEDLENVPAYAAAELLYNSDTEYETITLPVIQNFEAPIDTFYYIVIANTSEDSYFLIDNVNFNDENSGCTIEAPMLSTSSDDQICICSALDVNFGLAYDEDPAYTYNEIIFNENGIIESVDDYNKGLHSEFCSFSEGLSAVVIAYEGFVEGLSRGQNIENLSGCFALSNEIALETYSLEEFEFNVFVDGEQQEESFTICLMDEIVEVLSFSTDSPVENVAIFLINNETELAEIRIDGIDETTTLPNIPPGEYIIGAVGYEGSFNLEVGQGAEDITFEGCFTIPEQSYFINVLGPDENCVTNIEEIYSGNLSVRPNYSTGLFEIDNPNNEAFQFVVRDISGKTVAVSSDLSNDNLIDLSNHPNGLYVVSFQIEGSTHQEKIVKL